MVAAGAPVALGDEAGFVWRQVAGPAVLAAAIAGVVLAFGPAGPDTPAHLFQRGFFLQHGYSLWNNFWYAGQYDFVNYSLIVYPVAAVVGLGGVAVVSMVVASISFTLLVRPVQGAARRWTVVAFAVLWPAMVLTGEFPFALGSAFALAAAAGLQRQRHWVFSIGAALALAASPLAFLFLCLPLAGLLWLHRREWRRYRWPIAVVSSLCGVELCLSRVFPSGGRYPFWGTDFAIVCAVCALGWAFCWRVERLRSVRPLFVLYAVVAAAVFILPTEIGGNIGRLRLLGVPLALLLAGARNWRPRWLCLGLVVAGGVWNATALTAAYGQSKVDTTARPEYWQPAVLWLDAHLAIGYRVEAVDTTSHWAAVYLPAAGIPLARGWFRQADFPVNELLYHPLSAADYVDWLHRLGVGYVVLSDAPPDYSSVGEAALLRSGQSGLTLVAQAGAVSIYSVPDARPLIVGPGSPAVTQFTSGGLSIAVDQPGTFHIAVRWSPYWRTTLGCVAQAPDGMITLTTSAPGSADLTLIVSPSAALRSLAGRAGTCGTG